MSAQLAVTTDNQPLSIGDTERRSGLYILGKPRMGKSWLLVNMIIQDLKKYHGIFFIDPHGDAIDQLMQHAWSIDRFLLLDPEDKDYSFGINLLQCQHLANQKARNDTFTRAKGVFDKLWKNTFEERPWLQLILQNTLYAFIENQGYTLAELPLFFRNRDFRHYIAGNIQYNHAVSDYWLKTFPAKSTRDQDLQMEAAQTRAEIMLGHPYVADIVGQTKTTLDFQKLMDERHVIFVRLSSALSYESKKIIGTILISELKHAIERRPPDKRHQFCIFIDEFQNFASFEDFSTLITQAPKFVVATTIAHHDRFGQLGDNKEIIGATSAIANKILFQITGKDAADFAPELAEDPPTEIKLEPQYVISQEPIRDLIQGHTDPQILEFVNKFLRSLLETREDLKGDMERARIKRMIDLDICSRKWAN
jgi:hypothetical protein